MFGSSLDDVAKAGVNTVAVREAGWCCWLWGQDHLHEQFWNEHIIVHL